MNEIAIINKALAKPKIKELQECDLIERMKILIAKTYTLKGYGCDQETLKFMAFELSRAIKERFRSLTIEEVAISLDKGVKCDFGEYSILSVVTFLQWIKSYKESEARNKALEEAKKRLLPAERSLTQEELELKKKENAWIDFQIFVDHGVFLCLPSTYDLLDRMEIISYSDEMKHKFMSMATNRLIEQNKSAQFKTKNEWAIKDLVNEIRKIASKTEDGKEQIVNEAKKMILEEFYRKVISENIDLKVLIYSK